MLLIRSGRITCFRSTTCGKGLGCAGAAAAVASAAARAEEAPQRLPDFARALERKQERQQKDLQYQTGPAQAEAPKPVRAGAKGGRNDPCPCGSGKKYRKCHGANL